MGYQEIEHLSDRAIRVTSTTLEELFVDAAQGMYFIMDVFCSNDTVIRELSLDGMDLESLLVAFLSECLTMAELKNLALRSAAISFTENRCTAHMTLSTIQRKTENIKAVTFSEMKILKNNGGFETVVVFDL